MTVYVGTTNIDGTGSSRDLNSENSFEVPFDLISGPPEDESWPEATWVEGYIDQNLSVTETTEKFCVYCFDYSANASNLSTWNAPGLKEIAIYDCDDSYVEINNFVDVTYVTDYYGIWGPGHDGYQALTINGAKRGYIDTRNLEGNSREWQFVDEDSPDYGYSFEGYHEMDTTTCWSDITIRPHSNGDSWSNLFEIYTGYAEDTVYFSSYQDGDIDTSTQWTEFKVDLGEDNDIFIYGIEHSVSDAQQRFVDGGEGNDVLFLPLDTDDLDFVNFELISSNHGSLYLDQSLLANNQTELGLIINDTSVQLSPDVTDIEVNTLNEQQIAYLETTADWQQYSYNGGYSFLSSEEFVAVNVTVDEQSYTLLMNNADELMLG
ncbi:hypothetical protein ACFSJQ_22245 [Vibrio olivae]|uniref:Uncharacterized protein n=1 Tax=Vibrio olivae TaxID=1243002 RepID=A0ABV5HPI6_9VIBR